MQDAELRAFSFYTPMNTKHSEVPFTFVYLIRDLDTKLIKIGHSTDPDQRLRSLKKQPTLLPRQNNFELLFAWQSCPCREQYLHALFVSQRVRGEWFDLDEDDIDFVRATFHHAPEWTTCESDAEDIVRSQLSMSELTSEVIQ